MGRLFSIHGFVPEEQASLPRQDQAELCPESESHLPSQSLALLLVLHFEQHSSNDPAVRISEWMAACFQLKRERLARCSVQRMPKSLPELSVHAGQP